jgi:hypothetical protein
MEWIQMTMSAYEKIKRSQTLKAVVTSAQSLGIEVVDQFDQGGRALVGTRGFETVVWLESDGRWHTLAD